MIFVCDNVGHKAKDCKFPMCYTRFNQKEEDMQGKSYKKKKDQQMKVWRKKEQQITPIKNFQKLRHA